MTATQTDAVTAGGGATVTLPFTGEEYLESLRDGREVWIYGERVEDITAHPAFRNSARSVARLYDALHDPERQAALTVATDTGSGGFTHSFFRVPRSADDLRAARGAIVEWQRLCYGFMGRTPDYKAAFLGTLGANADFYAPYQDNARRWYARAQERVLFMNHALVHPPIDRDRPADQVADVCVHVEEENDNGLVVSGAKVVATASALTHQTFIAHAGLPLKDKRFAPIFIVDMNTPGVRLLARASYELVAAATGSPFDYPLSSRLDENDSILIFDRALIPWENVLAYDVDQANQFMFRSGFTSRAQFQGMLRLGVKLDFIAGLLLKATEAAGNKKTPRVQANVGEVIAWRNVVWAMTDGMIEGCEPWAGGSVQPNCAYALTAPALGPQIYGRVKEIIEHTVGSSLIYLNSNAADFKNPEMRGFLDQYLRGSDGYTSVDRAKVMKLLWDALGSEFGGRHELYERNYAGNAEDTRRMVLSSALAGGDARRFTGLAEQCMSEYDLDGWTVPGFVAPDDISLWAKR
ncbi:MAG TPA: 4-hydroxyphenylacetate 3-hydroxylase family protein [Trebonia sp.]|jgi:4-hydroxyphenylacetate 3-monooxygenase|nr:4-hydroxyphenylacetate 3-hydroxylase family protein [Trebonia sp.]